MAMSQLSSFSCTVASCPHCAGLCCCSCAELQVQLSPWQIPGDFRKPSQDTGDRGLNPPEAGGVFWKEE